MKYKKQMGVIQNNSMLLKRARTKETTILLLSPEKFEKESIHNPELVFV